MEQVTLTSRSKLVLYSYWRSSCSYRVRLALARKKLAYEYAPVDLLKDEQSSAAHKALNPMGYVPCLLLEGTAYYESAAIIELLDELHPEPPLFPRTPQQRARVRALVEMVNADIQPLQNRHVMLYRSSELEEQKTWAKHFIVRGLAALEAAIERNAKDGVKGPFAYGDAPTAADFFLVPQVYNARRFHVDLAPYPRVVAAEQAVLATDWAKTAIPEAQPDAPKQTHRE